MHLCRNTVTMSPDAVEASWRGAYASSHDRPVGVLIRLGSRFVGGALRRRADNLAAVRERRCDAAREHCAGCNPAGEHYAGAELWGARCFEDGGFGFRKFGWRSAVAGYVY